MLEKPPKNRVEMGWQLTLNVALLDLIADLLGRAAVNLAANAESGTEDFQHRSLELTGERLVGGAHGAGNVNNLVEGDRLVVLNVLLLLAVTRRLLECADDEGGSGRHNRHGSLSVLNGELDGHAQTFLFHALVGCVFCLEQEQSYPVTGGLCDVFTDLLGRQTQGTDLGSEGCRRTDLTASGAKVARNTCQSLSTRRKGKAGSLT